MAFSFGALLREHRRNAGLTQEQLAARASISGQAVGALERGTRRFPQQYTVSRLADALGLDDEQRAVFTEAAASKRRERPAAAPIRRVMSACPRMRRSARARCDRTRRAGYASRDGTDRYRQYWTR